MQYLINDDATKWYSKKEICSICNVDEKTFRRFFEEVRLDSTVQPKVISERDFISVGSSHKKLYAEPILQKFQLWLKRNAMNAGGQRTEGSVIKQDNQQDLFIGCVATKGTPDEIRSLAQHLQNFANQKELLEQTKQQNIEVVEENGVLKLENKQLVEENNYLKKLNNFNTTQLEYYTKKYHSWYDNYENY